jgi:hypothetical protein
MGRSSTTFSKDKQPKVKKGKQKTERTKILEALARAGTTEEGFYDQLIDRSKNPDDTFMIKELITRMSPVPKAVAPLVAFKFPKDAPPGIQAAHVLDAVANGIIPSDIGSMFISSIKTMIDIDEYTALKDRIAEIESSLGISNG